MDLRTLITCLSDHYAWKDEITRLRELATLLRELAEEADGIANEREKAAA